MKKIFYFLAMILGIIVMACGENNRGERNASVDSVLQNIRKYDQIALHNGETSVNIYVKKGEKADGIYDIEDFFYISFIDKNVSEYKGKRFLDNPESKINEKGKLINKPLRHYIVHLNKGEKVLGMNLNRVKTTKRTINIHYIYE